MPPSARAFTAEVVGVYYLPTRTGFFYFVQLSQVTTPSAPGAILHDENNDSNTRRKVQTLKRLCQSRPTCSVTTDQLYTVRARRKDESICKVSS